jgi:hypothetical protein
MLHVCEACGVQTEDYDKFISHFLKCVSQEKQVEPVSLSAPRLPLAFPKSKQIETDEIPAPLQSSASKENKPEGTASLQETEETDEIEPTDEKAPSVDETKDNTSIDEKKARSIVRGAKTLNRDKIEPVPQTKRGDNTDLKAPKHAGAKIFESKAIKGKLPNGDKVAKEGEKESIEVKIPAKDNKFVSNRTKISKRKKDLKPPISERDASNIKVEENQNTVATKEHRGENRSIAPVNEGTSLHKKLPAEPSNASNEVTEPIKSSTDAQDNQLFTNNQVEKQYVSFLSVGVLGVFDRLLQKKLWTSPIYQC